MNAMGKLVKALAAVVLGLLLTSLTTAQTIKMPPHEKIVLKNGLTVLLLEKHGVPIVSFAALVKSGSAADPTGQEGLASQL